MGIAIAVVICVTLFVAFKLDMVHIHIHISHTTEISDSVKLYEKEIRELNAIPPADIPIKPEDEATELDILTAVRNMWEGVEEEND